MTSGLAIPYAVAMLAAAGGIPKYGSVRVASERVVWEEAGSKVVLAQFAPDSSRIVFTAEGSAGLLIGSVGPDGKGATRLLQSSGTKCGALAVSGDSKQVGAILKRGDTQLLAIGPISGPMKEAEKSDGIQGLVPLPQRVVAFRDDAVPGGPYKGATISRTGALFAATKDLPSPVGIVRGAGLWAWDAPKDLASGAPIVARRCDNDAKIRQVLDPGDWLVGVAYYKHLITFAPHGGKEPGGRIRFIGARLKPFPGLDHRPLGVWEIPAAGGEPVLLGAFGWWPRYWRGDPSCHGATGWNVGIDGGQYMADFGTGKVYKYEKKVFERGVRGTYSHDCGMVALPGTVLKVLVLEKKEAPDQ